jgi:hypothetical protein
MSTDDLEELLLPVSGYKEDGFCFVRFVFIGVSLKIIISRTTPPCILVDFYRR